MVKSTKHYSNLCYTFKFDRLSENLIKQSDIAVSIVITNLFRDEIFLFINEMKTPFEFGSNVTHYLVQLSEFIVLLTLSGRYVCYQSLSS